MSETLTIYRRSELEAVSAGCLFRYDQIWNHHVPDDSDMANLGIGFHAIQYRYTMKLVDAGLTADAECAQQAFVEGVAAAQTPVHLLPELRRVWSWHAEHWELNLEQFITAEEKGSGQQVGFTPDLVTANPAINELEVHDFKSGWQPIMSEDELRGLYQARVYIRYAKDRWPNFASYRFTLYATRFNKVTTVRFTDEELDQIEQEVAAAIAKIEKARATNEWPAVPGPSCRFCSLVCPVMDQPALVPRRLTDLSQAEKLAGFVLAGDAMIKAAKKVLKSYASANGPIEVNGVVFANRESTTTLYPIDVVLEVLKQRNILGAFEDAKQQGLTISKSALAKLFKAYPMLQEDLKAYAMEKPTYRFSARQAGQEDDDE